MYSTLKQLYRYIRHDTRVRINFIHNYFLVKKKRESPKREKETKKIIGIFLLEHLGDIIACEPVARYLKRMNPDAFVVWGVKKTYGELVENNPYIDMTILIHCLSEKLMLSNAGLFDEIVDLHFPDRYCSLCSRPLNKHYDSSKINLKNYFHYGSLLSAMSQCARLPALDDKPSVYIPLSALRNVDNLHLPDKFIVINCTSNAPEKGWPVEKWIQLLTKIKDRIGLHVFEIGMETFLDESLLLSRSLCGKLSILESAEVIRRAKLFIGIDSGPAHLANAIGTYGIILTGDYLGFEKYNPFSGAYGDGSNAFILYTNGPAAAVQADNVFAEVKQYLDKS